MDDLFDKTIYEIRQRLAEVIRSRVGWQVACVALLLLWLGYFLDRTFEPSTYVRQYALVVVGIITVVWFLFRLLPTLWFQPSDEQIVGLMARAKPRSADLIFSAERLGKKDSEEDRQTEVMHLLTRQQANEELSSADFSSLFRNPSHSRWARIAIVTGLGALLSCFVFPSEASFYLRRLALSNESWPRLVSLIPEGFEYDKSTGVWIKHFARHTAVDLRLMAELKEEIDAPSSVLVKSSKLFGRKYPESMLRIGGVEEVQDERGAIKRTQQYLLRLDDLGSDVELKLRGGDDQIRVRLIATDQPVITSALLTVISPDYLDRADRQLNPSMLGKLPEGSACLATFRPSKALSLVRASWNDDNVQTPTEIKSNYDSGVISIKLPRLMQSGILSVNFSDVYGIDAKQAYEIPIDIQKDAPPKVSGKIVTYGRLITKQARLPISARVDDDYGIKRSYLELIRDAQLVEADKSNGKASSIVELPDSDLLPLESLQDIDLLSLFKEASSLKEGDQLRVRVGAEDLYDLQPRPPSLSEPIILQVVSNEELLASLGDRERELRKRLEATLSDARRLAYSIGQSIESAESPRNRSEWQVETEKIMRDLSGLIAQIQSIHDEAINNRLDRSSLTDRLETAVLDPLKSLISVDLKFLLAQFKNIPTEKISDKAASGGETQDTEIAQFADSANNIVRVLTLVIEAMQTNESYNEIVASLRAILRDQKQLNQLTERERREQAKRILLDGGFDDF